MSAVVAVLEDIINERKLLITAVVAFVADTAIDAAAAAVFDAAVFDAVAALVLVTIITC